MTAFSRLHFRLGRWGFRPGPRAPTRDRTALLPGSAQNNCRRDSLGSNPDLGCRPGEGGAPSYLLLENHEKMGIKTLAVVS